MPPRQTIPPPPTRYGPPSVLAKVHPAPRPVLRAPPPPIIQLSAAVAPAPAQLAQVKIVDNSTSYDNLKAKIADDAYYVNAKYDFWNNHPQKHNKPSKATYGAVIRIIRKDQTENTLQTHFHVHYTRGGAVDSAHLKKGRHRWAAGIEMSASEGLTLLNALWSLLPSSKAWTDIKGITL